MDPLDSMPITKAAMASGPGRPPALIEEWDRMVTEDQNLVLLWAGCWRRRQSQWGWVWFSTRVHGDEGADPHPLTTVPAVNLERLLSPLAHEARIRIMQAMYDGPKAAGELSEATGLRGGNLYYHLRELLHAAYVKEMNGGYDLTPLGGQILLTLSSIAKQVIKDEGEQGLLVSPASGFE